MNPAAWPYYYAAGAPLGGEQQPAAPSNMRPPTEKELRSLRRKQANRDSAKRSKQRKKQEVEALSHRSQELEAEHQGLRQQVEEAQQRLADVHGANLALRIQIKAAMGVDVMRFKEEPSDQLQQPGKARRWLQEDRGTTPQQ